ncbi:MAG: tetratricopeptide repeat protein, partial [Thiogranum sp.]|nr:tetratricopeptide repeat protein [Thiogranum sp.]
VLVDFWADWCAPCKMLLPVLLKLVEEYQGKFQLAKVNTDMQRNLAAQHGIRSLPTLRLYRDGQAVEEVLGAQPESVLRALLDKYIERASDALLRQALALHAQGEVRQALELLEQASSEDPENLRLPLEIARLLIEDGQLDRAEGVLATLPVALLEEPEVDALRAMLQFARATAEAPSAQALESALEADPNQSEARYQLAARQALASDYDRAMDNFMELLRRDRNFGDGAAQKALVAIFALLGDSDARVARYRRQMFNLLH